MLFIQCSVTCLKCFFPQHASKRRDKSGNPICWSHPCREGFRDSVQSDSRILLSLLVVRQKGHSKKRWQNKIFLISTFVEGHKRGQTILDIRLLQELWTPLLKVKSTWSPPLYLQVRHVKSTANDVGLSFSGRALGMVNIDGKAHIEYSESTRAEVSCPMDFWNYPFDTQFCNFILEPLNLDFQLVNSPILHSSQMDDQNIKMSYDIEILPLPEELLVRHPDPVSFSCQDIKPSHNFIRRMY